MTVDREFSAKTVENRTKTLQKFCAVVGEAMPDAAAMRTYREWLLSQPLKTVSRASYLITVRNFVKFLNGRKWCEFSYLQIDIPRVPLPDKPWLTEQEVRTMVDAIPADTIIGLRDKAVLAVVFSSGIRASECVSLTEDSFNAQGAGSVLGKGKKRRPIFASRWALRHLQLYLATKHQLGHKNAADARIRGSRPMFDGYRRLTIGNGRWSWVPCSFSAAAFTKVVRRNALKHLGRKLSAHSLRHGQAEQGHGYPLPARPDGALGHRIHPALHALRGRQAARAARGVQRGYADDPV